MEETCDSFDAWQVYRRYVAAAAIAALLAVCATQPTAFRVASRPGELRTAVIERVSWDGVAFEVEIGPTPVIESVLLSDLAYLAGPVSRLRQSLGRRMIILLEESEPPL